MKLALLPLGDLCVNPNNDRHGELSDESAAINWLLTHHERHMRNLAADIVKQRKIERTAEHLYAKGLISEKYKRDLQRFASSDAIVSAGTMNRYYTRKILPLPRAISWPFGM